jgi:hypothetical protein
MSGYEQILAKAERELAADAKLPSFIAHLAADLKSLPQVEGRLLLKAASAQLTHFGFPNMQIDNAGQDHTGNNVLTMHHPDQHEVYMINGQGRIMRHWNLLQADPLTPPSAFEPGPFPLSF